MIQWKPRKSPVVWTLAGVIGWLADPTRSQALSDLRWRLITACHERQGIPIPGTDRIIMRRTILGRPMIGTHSSPPDNARTGGEYG